MQNATKPGTLLQLTRVLAVLSTGLYVTTLIGCGGGGSPNAGLAPSNEISLTLLWDPNPESEHVSGYLVFFGTTVDTPQLISTLHIGSGEIDARAPSVSYEASKQLGLRPGDTACFRVKAFNEAAESDFSNPACKTLG